MAILHENPNVGNRIPRLSQWGGGPQSGSYFGKDAADFLNGLNLAVGAGLLSPREGMSAYIGPVEGRSIGRRWPDVRSDPLPEKHYVPD